MKSSTISSTKTIPPDRKVRILAVNWNENTIGYLAKEEDGEYFYKYDYKGIQEARKNGYSYLIGFKDTRKVYTSKELFPVFKSRIPTKQRRDLAEILASYGIENYDELDLLALSGGRLLTDSISFEEFVPEKSKTRRARREIKRDIRRDVKRDGINRKLDNNEGAEVSGR